MATFAVFQFHPVGALVEGFHTFFGAFVYNLQFTIYQLTCKFESVFPPVHDRAGPGRRLLFPNSTPLVPS